MPFRKVFSPEMKRIDNLLRLPIDMPGHFTCLFTGIISCTCKTHEREFQPGLLYEGIRKVVLFSTNQEFIKTASHTINTFHCARFGWLSGTFLSYYVDARLNENYRFGSSKDNERAESVNTFALWQFALSF